jgi:hypothetical protein
MRKTLQKLEQDQRKGKKGLSGDADVEVRRRSLLGLLLFAKDNYCLVCQGLLLFSLSGTTTVYFVSGTTTVYQGLLLFSLSGTTVCPELLLFCLSGTTV